MNAFVRQIAVLAVLWAVCELLLPDGKHQQMVRMTASLLVMTALLTTVNNWLGGAQNVQPVMTVAMQQAAEDTYQRTALAAMANQVQGYCERMAEHAGYEASAAVYLMRDGKLDHVQLVLNQPEHALMSADRLARTLANQLGVEEERIRLSVEGS